MSKFSVELETTDIHGGTTEARQNLVTGGLTITRTGAEGTVNTYIAISIPSAKVLRDTLLAAYPLEAAPVEEPEPELVPYAVGTPLIVTGDTDAWDHEIEPGTAVVVVEYDDGDESYSVTPTADEDAARWVGANDLAPSIEMIDGDDEPEPATPEPLTFEPGDRVVVTWGVTEEDYSGPGTYVHTTSMYHRVKLDSGRNDYLPCLTSELAPLRPE